MNSECAILLLRRYNITLSCKNLVAFRHSRTVDRSDSLAMATLYKAFGLLLLLLMAQHGAVEHDLSHFVQCKDSGIQAHAIDGTEAPCALCPAFAQVITPAFSHSFHFPLLVRLALEAVSEPRYVAIDAAVLRPRSRGPPSLS